jgi:dephospho-CoA kinase
MYILFSFQTIRRVQARDGLSAEDAEKRVAAQVSNHERVLKANFVFCSLWEVDFTHRQADKAWLDIESIINTL